MSLKVMALHLILLVLALAQAQAGPPPVALCSGAPAATLADGPATALPAFLTGQMSQPIETLFQVASCGFPGGCCCPHTQAKTTRLEGRGASCTAALADLSNLTDDQVYANCGIGGDGVCTEADVTVTIACAYNASEGGYSVTGYRSYTCVYCN